MRQVISLERIFPKRDKFLQIVIFTTYSVKYLQSLANSAFTMTYQTYITVHESERVKSSHFNVSRE